MSLEPSPCTRPSAMRPGMLSFAGTVSRCPAKTTSGRPVAGSAKEQCQVVVVDALERHDFPHQLGERVLVAALRRHVHELERPSGEVVGHVRDSAPAGA